MKVDKTEIVRTLEAVFAPGDVFEIRILDALTQKNMRPHTVNGYFDYEHIRQAADEIENMIRFCPGAFAAAYGRIVPVHRLNSPLNQPICRFKFPEAFSGRTKTACALPSRSRVKSSAPSQPDTAAKKMKHNFFIADNSIYKLNLPTVSGSPLLTHSRPGTAQKHYWSGRLSECNIRREEDNLPPCC